MQIKISVRKLVLGIALTAIIATGAYFLLRPPAAPPPVPRITAYPRQAPQESPDSTAYLPLEGAPLNFQIPSTATAVHDTAHHGWYTVTYPGSALILYLTINKINPDNYDRTVDNRLQRIDLNLNGIKAETQEFANKHGFEGILVTALQPCATPLQFLAIDRTTGWLATGTLFNPQTNTPPDTPSPSSNALPSDTETSTLKTHLLTALSNLKPLK